MGLLGDAAEGILGGIGDIPLVGDFAQVALPAAGTMIGGPLGGAAGSTLAGFMAEGGPSLGSIGKSLGVGVPTGIAMEDMLRQQEEQRELLNQQRELAGQAADIASGFEDTAQPIREGALSGMTSLTGVMPLAPPDFSGLTDTANPFSGNFSVDLGLPGPDEFASALSQIRGGFPQPAGSQADRARDAAAAAGSSSRRRRRPSGGQTATSGGGASRPRAREPETRQFVDTAEFRNLFGPDRRTIRRR